jgi:hypothetical protein
MHGTNIKPTTDVSEIGLYSIAQSFMGQWLFLKAVLCHIGLHTSCERKCLPDRSHHSLIVNTTFSESLDLALNWRHCSSDKVLFLIVEFEIVITVFCGSLNVRTRERILNLLYRHYMRFLNFKEELKIISVWRSNAPKVTTEGTNRVIETIAIACYTFSDVCRSGLPDCLRKLNFFALATNIYGSSVWNLFYFTIPAHRIWRWLLEFAKCVQPWCWSSSVRIAISVILR